MVRPARAVIVSLAIVIVLLVGVQIADSLIFGSVGSDIFDQTVERDAARYGDTVNQDFVSVNSVTGENETVYKTTGYALNLTGANDSQLNANDGYDLENDTSWHVSVWARVAAGAGGDTREVASISDGEIRIYRNGSANEWRVWYYRQDTRNSYEASVPTNNSVGNLTNIQAKANDSHLVVYRNTTAGTAVAITGSNTVDAPTEANNWDGTIEELRTFGEPLDATNRSNLYNSPAEQRQNLDRTMRVMFDKPADQDAAVLLQGSDATVSNGSLDKVGFDEQVMDPETTSNNLNGDTDYKFDENGPKVAREDPPAGDSELKGAPAAFVTYKSSGSLVVPDVSNWFGVAALIPIVLLIIAIVARIQSM